MNDTSPEAAELVREAWLGLSEGRRLALAAEMFDAARAVVLASLPADLTAAERRAALCERFYGAELASCYRLAVAAQG